MTFESYKLDHSREWQHKISKSCWIGSILVLICELAIFSVFYSFGALLQSTLNYLIIRIIIPSGINFSATIIFTLFINYFPKYEVKRDFFACLNSFIVCSTIAIFHNYFTFMFVWLIVPLFICSIFANKTILNKIFILCILSYIASSITMWFDPSQQDLLYKIVSIVCAGLMLIICHWFSRIVISSQIEQVNVIFFNFQHLERLIEDMKVEPLTKLSNRTALSECIDFLIKKFNSENTSPFMVIIDIDHFKNINDTFGHSSGDDVLIKLADLLSSKMKGIKRTFRFGGEEFVLLFDSITKGEVLSFVEDIRMSFENMEFDFAKNMHFTISAGISPLKKDWNSAHWIESADSALYKAKNGGRNQVVMIDF